MGETIGYASLTARRDALAARVKEAELALAALRSDFDACVRALAGLDAAGDLSGHVRTVLPALRLMSGWRRSYHSNKIDGRSAEGGDLREMFRSAIGILNTERLMVGTCKNYEHWHNQFCGWDSHKHNPRHGYATWWLEVRSMSDAQRESAHAVLRALADGRLSASAFADVCDEAARAATVPA